MKKLFLITGLSLLATLAFAQKIAHIVLPNNSISNTITFLVDETVLVNITPDGKIIDWGIENNMWRQFNYSYPPRLEKYMGKEEYYPAIANDGSRGKVKYIGRTGFTYYSSAENERWTGKIKSIGGQSFEYYSSYDRREFSGSLKTANRTLFFGGVKYYVIN